MPHDGMPRAYLRIDPNLDLTQDDPGAFIRLLCAAARQPDRGRFRTRVLLERAVGKPKARVFIERCDVSPLPDGRYYVEGWDEWQEGDYTVAERMRRMRERRAARHAVTPAPSPERNTATLAPTLSVTTDAVSISTGDGGGGGEIPPPPMNGGSRRNGTHPRGQGRSPRQKGTNPRAVGESPRQERQAQKTGPTALSAIFAQLSPPHPVPKPTPRRKP